jgi:hypothetical protein
MLQVGAWKYCAPTDLALPKSYKTMSYIIVILLLKLIS